MRGRTPGARVRAGGSGRTALVTMQHLLNSAISQLPCARIGIAKWCKARRKMPRYAAPSLSVSCRVPNWDCENGAKGRCVTNDASTCSAIAAVDVGATPTAYADVSAVTDHARAADLVRSASRRRPHEARGSARAIVRASMEAPGASAWRVGKMCPTAALTLRRPRPAATRSPDQTLAAPPRRTVSRGDYVSRMPGGAVFA